MTTNDEQIRRFRSEVPLPGKPAWAAVRDAVAREITAELERACDGRRISRWTSPRALASGLAGLLLTGAVAYGATALIGVGSPAPNPPSSGPPSTIKVLGLRVEDPAGGPPWGLRLALSGPRVGSRSDVAIQIGRIRNGQMGFIGQDNAFHNDHLFHAAGANSALVSPANYPIPGTPQKPDLQSVYHFALTLPGVASANNGCSNIKVPVHPLQPKRAIEREEQSLKHALAILRQGGPAARREAHALGGSVAGLRVLLAKELKRTQEQRMGHITERTFDSCPSQDLRTLIVGFSGPDSTSITISGFGTKQTESLDADDDGFYLFVLANHWNYGSRFQATITCRNGHTTTGLAAPGTPNPPRCPAP